MNGIIKKGLMLLMLVPMLALSVSVLSGDVASAQTISGGIGGGASAAQGEGQAATLFGDGGIFKMVTNILLYLIGAISVIMLIIGGIRYVVSGGDQSAVTGAKNTILYAIVGIVVAFLAFAAVNFVTTNLGSVNQ
ncbi:hypothetical protein KA093_00645 [Candidatus Saccharibacteria bacterium]|nr:hypothetical protein [Candidatus Saccharibacteria bacterium]